MHDMEADTMSRPGDPGTFEWWYFDAVLESTQPRWRRARWRVTRNCT
jgi:hypothetical protein